MPVHVLLAGLNNLYQLLWNRCTGRSWYSWLCYGCHL